MRFETVLILARTGRKFRRKDSPFTLSVENGVLVYTDPYGRSARLTSTDIMATDWAMVS